MNYGNEPNTSKMYIRNPSSKYWGVKDNKLVTIEYKEINIKFNINE